MNPHKAARHTLHMFLKHVLSSHSTDAEIGEAAIGVETHACRSIENATKYTLYLPAVCPSHPSSMQYKYMAQHELPVTRTIFSNQECQDGQPVLLYYAPRPFQQDVNNPST